MGKKVNVDVVINFDVELEEGQTLDDYMSNTDIVNIDPHGDYNHATFKRWEGDED